MEEEIEEEIDVDDDDEINEPELRFPYEEMDPLNLPPPGFDSKSEDEVVPTSGPTFQLPPPIHRFSGSVYVRGESSSAAYVDNDGDILTPDREKENRRRNAKLDTDLVIEEQFSSRMEQRVTMLEDHFRESGDAEDRVERKKLKRDLEARISNTILHMDKERVERDLY
ncbi:hypothetical protein Tco_0436552 [Tanacetum coccineum]